MKRIIFRGVSYRTSSALPCTLLLARIAGAQVPEAAAEASVAPEPLLPGASAEPTASDAGASDGFMHRYQPEANLFEAGVFLGPLFISDRNSFRGATTVDPQGRPTVKPLSKFDAAPEIGIRAGYYPLSFLGAELEGMLAVANTDSGEGATALAGRAQAVLQLPYFSVVPFALAGAGYWHVQNDVSGNDGDPAFHFGGGAKVHLTRNLAVRFDVRDSITNRRGTSGSLPHHLEALAGANLVFGREPAAPVDSDQDGVLDGRDQCPLEAGTPPNGCPARDSDGDNVMDPDDQCMQEPGIFPTGCPIRDVDRDGVLDPEDQCISEKGGAPTGCPDTDRDGFLDREDQCLGTPGVSPDGCPADPDGDGLLGADDRCPEVAETKNGFEDTDGCADELPTAVKDFMGVLAGIEFDNDQAAIRAGSELALDKALSVLTEFPSLRVEIIGHTDDRGSRNHNLALSQSRAEAVKAYLAAKGIDASRIQTRGAGPDSPLGANDTAAGRQKNRRIEFRIIR